MERKESERGKLAIFARRDGGAPRDPHQGVPS